MNSIELWEYCLNRIFNLPASIVLITGDWKTGKTDFGLLLFEELMRLGIIKKGASNVITTDSEIQHIQDMYSLRSWMYGDRIPKMFLYDESITGTPKRRAMSKLNVDWLKHIIPELSKGKGKLVVITQELDFTESVFYHPTFLRGMFRKINRKTAILNSPLLKTEVTFHDVPRTSVGFDPYVIATFRSEKILDTSKMTEGEKVATLYAQGSSMDEIGKSFNPPKHRYAIARILRKHLQTIKELKSQVTYNSAKDKDTIPPVTKKP